MDENKPNKTTTGKQAPPAHRDSLLLEETRLRERLQAIARDIRGGLDPDSEERAVQLENREVLEEIERVTRIELERIRKLISEADAQSTDQA